MSLINDALKRAKQAEPEPSRIPAAAGPMQPVDYQRPGLPWFFVPVLLAVMVGGCWFLLKGWDAHRQAAAGYSEPITVKAREPVTPLLPPDAPATAAPPAEPPFPVAVNPAPSSAPAGINRNFSLDDSTSPRAATAPAPGPAGTTGAPETSAPSASTGPTFRLQGIFYRNTGPSAMVNGKSVFVGDRVSGARVRAIERDSVTLEFDGQLKTLTIE